MAHIPLTHEGVYLKLWLEGVLAGFTVRDSGLASLALITLLCIKNMLANALVFSRRCLTQLPSIPALEALSIISHGCNFFITLQALQLSVLFFAVHAINKLIAALDAFRRRQALIKIVTMSAFNAHVIDVAHSTILSICLRGAVMTLILIKSEALLALQTSLSFGIRLIFPTVPAATHTLLTLTVNRAEIVPCLTNFALVLPIAIILAKGAALLAFLA